MIHTKPHHINPSMKMADLIHADYRLLLTLSRFNIPLGFKDKSIREVCENNGVDLDCFLSITRFLMTPNNFELNDFIALNAASVLAYLKNSHVYFLEKRLPDLRQRLENIFFDADNASKSIIMKFFEDYYQEVQEHMNYENDVVFPYIEALLAGNPQKNFSIDEFETHHTDIREKLVDLKNLMIKYIIPTSDIYQTNNTLFDIFLTEQDLDTHCFIEDYILVPIVRKMEQKAL